MANRDGIPGRYRDMVLDDMVAGPGDPSAPAIAWVKKLAAGKVADGSYMDDAVFAVFSGGFGNGKTRAAAHLVQAARSAWFRRDGKHADLRWPYFVRASELVSMRFDDFSGPGFARTVVSRSAFLAIDDIGRLNGYKGEREFVEQVIERRFDESLSTVVTVNCPVSELGAERFVDFMKQFKEVPFGEGNSKR